VAHRAWTGDETFEKLEGVLGVSPDGLVQSLGVDVQGGLPMV
jgi:hypothetical protein